MRNSRHTLILLIAILVLSSGVAATLQTPSRPTRPAAASPTPRRAVTDANTKDPFIGVWKLNPGKSKYEAGGAPTSFTRTYEDRGGGTIFMTTDVTIPQGSTRTYLVYRRDGKPYPEAAAGVQSIRMVSVKAVDTRTEDVYLVVDGKASETPSTITIAANGSTMTQVVSGRDAKGKAFTNTIVYDKQP
jgi:FlaG/FlaF family flagellin (archaellin)